MAYALIAFILVTIVVGIVLFNYLKKDEAYTIYQLEVAINVLVWIDFVILIWIWSGFWFWPLVAAILWRFVYAAIDKSIKNRHYKRYITSDVKESCFIKLNEKSATEIGWGSNNPIFYIAKDNDSRVFFPESLKPDERYYLTDITFTPKFETTQTVQGKKGAALTGALLAGPIGAAIGASGKRKVMTNTKELSSTAYLSLLTTDYRTAISLNISCKSNTFNILNSQFKLNSVQLANIINQVKSSNNSSNDQ